MTNRKKQSKIFTYWIDVTGTCNLRCPSCPTGNYGPEDFDGTPNPVGVMDVKVYKRILEKIKVDDVSFNPRIHLYNWGEPLMHPKIGSLISLAKEEGFYCGVSSNLNFDKNLKEVVEAQPNYFSVSLSGFTQDIYGKTHKRGNIELVKDNMCQLRELIDSYSAKIYVEVTYHVYKNNAGDDLKNMLEFCNGLGFNFSPVWAYFMPLEKNLRLLSGDINDKDRILIENLAIKPDELISVSAPLKQSPCNVQERTMAINWDGSVQLCCNTYDYNNRISSSFLELEHEELQNKKKNHKLCGVCMSNGLHMVLSYGAGEKIDELGHQRLRSDKSSLIFKQFGEPKISDENGYIYEITGKPESEFSRKQIRGLRALIQRVSDKIWPS